MTGPVSARQLSPGEWAVLGAVCETQTHGFALAQLLGSDGELGRVWTLPRPVVYQVLKKLLREGLVTQRATVRSEVGPARTVVAASPAGRRAVQRWLAEPVDHIRDVRSLLLLKLALIERAGRDRAELIEAQRRRLEPVLTALEATRLEATGFDRVVAEWRVASAHATLQFLDSISPA